MSTFPQPQWSCCHHNWVVWVDDMLKQSILGLGIWKVQ